MFAKGGGWFGHVAESPPQGQDSTRKMVGVPAEVLAVAAEFTKAVEVKEALRDEGKATDGGRGLGGSIEDRRRGHLVGEDTPGAVGKNFDGVGQAESSFGMFGKHRAGDFDGAGKEKVVGGKEENMGALDLGQELVDGGIAAAVF